MEYSLRVKNLTKNYEGNQFRLKNISFDLPKGSIMGLVGKNGSGKSTTINLILNLMRKDAGEVKFFGKRMSDESTFIREEIGVVFDSINFYEELTADKLEKVLSNLYKNWDKALFFSYLKRFNLPRNKKLKTFSRGMGMKLSVSIALSHKAKILILDEVTAGLDPVAREEILDMFLEFVEDENNSILITSHISSDLEKIADYITIIDEGAVVLSESKDTLMYEYGIARMRQRDFEQLDRKEYMSWRHRGLQVEVLVADKKQFMRAHPEMLVDQISIDEMLPLMAKGE